MSSAAISLTWVRSFVVAAESGSMTAAAEVLYLTQPRISAHVRSLERRLGARLLIRNAGGVALTAHGRAFLPHAVRSLEALQDGVDQVDASRDVLRGAVRLGSYPGSTAVLLAPMIETFATVFPEVTFDLTESDSATVLAALRRGDVEWAIVAECGEPRHPDVELTTLCTERVMLVEPPSTTSAAPPESVLADSPQVLVSGDALHGVADYAGSLTALGIGADQLRIIQLPTTLVALVRAGIGPGVLGAFAASIAAIDRVRARDLPSDRWRRDIHLATRQGAVLTPASGEFVRRLRAEIANLTTGLAVEVRRDR